MITFICEQFMRCAGKKLHREEFGGKCSLEKCWNFQVHCGVSRPNGSANKYIAKKYIWKSNQYELFVLVLIVMHLGWSKEAFPKNLTIKKSSVLIHTWMDLEKLIWKCIGYEIVRTECRIMIYKQSIVSHFFPILIHCSERML